MHPRTDEWIEYAFGRLSDGARKGLERHLAEGCEACARQAKELRHLHETISADRLLSPSEPARQAVLRAFRRSEGVSLLPDWARSLEQSVARVVFDSFRSDLAFAGARASTAARRVRFEADRLELDVLVESEGDLRRITAQLLLLDPKPAPVSAARYLVMAGGHLEAEGATDVHGELVRELRTPGEIEIRLVMGKQVAVFRIPDDWEAEDP
jgi:hypothetical protein